MNQRGSTAYLEYFLAAAGMAVATIAVANWLAAQDPQNQSGNAIAQSLQFDQQMDRLAGPVVPDCGFAC